MKTIELEKVSSKPVGEYAKKLGDEILIFTSNKQPVAAMVPLKGVDPESLALSYHPEFMELIEKARRQVKAGQTLTLEEMKAEVEGMEDN